MSIVLLGLPMFPTLLELELPWIGPVLVQTYGIAAIAALAAGWLLVRRRLEDAGIDDEHAYWSLVWLIPAATIGGKLLPLVTDPLYRDLFAERLGSPGGAATVGLALATPGGSALSTGLVVFFVGLAYVRFYELPLGRCLDAAAPGAALAVPILRLGCLGAGCCYGTATALPWGLTYSDPAVAARTGVPLDVPLHPTQLYEGAAALLLCGSLVALGSRLHRPGVLALVSAAAYAAIRLTLQPLRADGGADLFGFDPTRLVAGAVLVAAVVAAGLLWRTPEPSGGPARRSTPGRS